MKLRLFFASAATLLAAGCATPSAYLPARDYDGYDDTRLQENVFAVSFAGNTASSQQRVFDFALLRCAEVTLANGFRFFTLSDARQDARTEIYHGVEPATNYGRFRTYETATYVASRPQACLIIVGYRERPDAASGVVYEADYLARSIRGKYGLRTP